MIVKRLGMKRDTNFEKLYALMGQELGMNRMPFIVYQPLLTRSQQGTE